MIMSKYTRKYQSNFDKHHSTDLDFPLGLLLWHSVTFDFNEFCSGNCHGLIQAADSNVNHILDGPVYVLARNMQNMIIIFYRKTHIFLCPKLLIFVTNGF